VKLINSRSILPPIKQKIKKMEKWCWKKMKKIVKKIEKIEKNSVVSPVEKW